MTAHDPDDPTARVVGGEVEVPGEPEVVWRTVATGSGIAAWFVPADVEEREGGEIVTHHGPFGDSVGVVTAWEPPRRFAYEERGWHPDAPDAPPWTTEVSVEPRGGGTCTVRLVSGFRSGGGGWEEALEGTREGWLAALRNLRLFLTHHAGQPTASLLAAGTVPSGYEEAARMLFAALHLDGLAQGDPVALPEGAPPTAGVLEDVLATSVAVHTTEPMPGLFEIGVWDFDRPTAVVRGYLYGEGGDAVAERVVADWGVWLRAHLEGFTPLG